MNSQKVENSFLSSFRRKPESSKFNYFWMSDQVRHDSFGTFYETIKFESDADIGGKDSFRSGTMLCVNPANEVEYING